MSTTTRASAEQGTESDVPAILAAHPRLIGALFMLALLLTQAGDAAAAGCATIAGP